MKNRFAERVRRTVSIRILLVAIATIALPVVIWAQWTTSSNNIYNSNSGYVGVGTTSPDHTLTLISGMSADWALKIRNTASDGVSGFGYYDNSDTWKGYVGYYNGTPNMLHLYGTSGVGISFYTNTAEVMRATSGGNVGIGTTTPSQKLEVSGGSIIASGRGNRASNTGPGLEIGWDGTETVLQSYNRTTSAYVPAIYAASSHSFVGDVTVSGNISAKYQDIAEWVPTSQKLPPGTVVVLSPGQGNSVLRSTSAYDTRVAGVISSTPGIVLGESGEGKVRVATTGRVKVHVDARHAPIEVGDLLVTSGRDGVAMRSEPLDLAGVKIHRPGTLIGKALESLTEGEGEILVLLSLQ